MRELSGIGVSRGVAVGEVRRMPEPVDLPEPSTPLPDAEREAAADRITEAAGRVRADLEARADSAKGTARRLLRAVARLADDETVLDKARARVMGGTRPERAVWEAAGEVGTMLRGIGGYLSDRAQDLRHVSDRIVSELLGRPAPRLPVSDTPFVLVATDLSAADAAGIEPGTVLAIVTVEGGPASHTAVLARALGLPAVVGVPQALELDEGTTVLVDGAVGSVVVDPSPELRERAARLIAAAEQRAPAGPGHTADGRPVQLLANVRDGVSAHAAAEAGAEGVGLFRTEFCFLGRSQPPSVERQVSAYAEVFAAFPGRPVVVRTLDGGSDKPIPFLHARPEPNPALGVRGLRAFRRRPEVLDDQLRAIARAARDSTADVRVMAPMVATVDEARDFVRRCAGHGLTAAGVMVEVPAAAIRAQDVLAHAAFASVGTNDLAQYTMAADRMVEDLADLNDPWQPAVLRLVELTVQGGQAHGRPVGVCGEGAADPALACVLVGLGVSSLSMAHVALADVSAALAAVTAEQCTAAARAALDADGPTTARSAARAVLTPLAELGL
jgi:phosphotransferase system enzyme I (PtsI)